MSFAELRIDDLQKIRAFRSDLALVSEWEDLVELSIGSLRDILACDCLCWNEWSPDLQSLSRVSSHDGYEDELDRRSPQLQETILQHPLVSSDSLLATKVEPKRISDFESVSRFRSNSLFTEVYQHVDASYQIAYTGATNGDLSIIISANRRASDFTTREMQLQQVACDTFAPIVNSLCELVKTKRIAEQISQLLRERCGLGNAESLTLGEWRQFRKLISAERSAGRDSPFVGRLNQSRKVASNIREKLGLGSTRELFAAVRELSPNANLNPSRD